MLSLNDDNLLDDMDDLTKTPLALLTQNSDVFEKALQGGNSNKNQ